MTGSFTDYLEEKVMKDLFGILAFTPPTTFFVGVCTGGVSEGGVVTGEPSGNAYARVSVGNGSGNWDYSQVAGVTVVANHAAIAFSEATGSWGTITDVFIADAASGGNILAFATLDASKAIGSGDTLQFDAGDLEIVLG